jgi:hypothetical protein
MAVALQSEVLSEEEACRVLRVVEVEVRIEWEEGCRASYENLLQLLCQDRAATAVTHWANCISSLCSNKILGKYPRVYYLVAF